MTGIAGHGASDGGGWSDGPDADAAASEPALTDRAHAPAAPLSEEGRRLHDAFAAAIDDDLDTPGALRIAREALRSGLPADERRWLVLDMDFVLGLDLDRAAEAAATAAPARRDAATLPDEVRRLLDARVGGASAARLRAGGPAARAAPRARRRAASTTPTASSDWRRLG